MKEAGHKRSYTVSFLYLKYTKDKLIYGVTRGDRVYLVGMVENRKGQEENSRN